jgi:hypothetical protein
MHYKEVFKPMKPKTKSTILLTILLLFSLTALSCGLLGGGDGEEDKATQPPTAEATQTTEKDPSTGQEPTKAPAGKEAEPTKSGASGEPSGEGGIFADPQESLDSYRMRTEMTLVEGEGMLGEKMTTEIEWVRDPEAQHSTMTGASGEVMLEYITIGDETWTSMDGQTWMHTTATPDQEPALPDSFQTDLEDIMKEMEGGMKKAGKDQVDGVSCQEYDLNADFALPFPIPEDASEQMLQFMPQEIQGHVEGKICVADERGLPEVIVRSVTRQEMTLKYASGKEESMTYDEDREMYDINEPITIEPPEGKVQEVPAMPTMPADLPTPPASGEETQPPAGEPTGAIAYAELNELDSYHLEWTVTIKTGDGEMTTGYAIDWTADPLAAHLTMGMGEGIPMMEYVLIDDQVWMKAGGQWMLGGKEELDEAINQVGEVLAPESDMALAGKETANGINCNHYVKEMAAPTTARLDVWIANQPDLPPIVVRGVSLTEMSGMTMTIEANVTAINQPITIEKPQ